MNFKQFVEDYRISTATPEMEHYRNGWIHIKCPCCDDDGTHLGFHVRSEEFTCWRCKGKSPAQVIHDLLRVRWPEAFEIVAKYTGRPLLRHQDEDTCTGAVTEVCLPYGCGPMQEIHREYLRGRKYDPGKLESIWNLMGTGALGDYKFRIIAPITVGGKFVSFQGRDISDKQKSKYKAADRTNEIIHHKDTVYGLDEVPYDTIIIVEGLPSVWRLGPGAVATFGTGWTSTQVKVLSKFKRRIVLYDSLKEGTDTQDKDAESSAKTLAAALSCLGGMVEVVSIEYKDPGEMPQIEADELMKELMK